MLTGPPRSLDHRRKGGRFWTTPGLVHRGRSPLGRQQGRRRARPSPAPPFRRRMNEIGSKRSFLGGLRQEQGLGLRSRGNPVGACRTRDVPRSRLAPARRDRGGGPPRTPVRASGTQGGRSRGRPPSAGQAPPDPPGPPDSSPPPTRPTERTPQGGSGVPDPRARSNPGGDSRPTGAVPGRRCRSSRCCRRRSDWWTGCATPSSAHLPRGRG
jgi:hypothetical protein